MSKLRTILIGLLAVAAVAGVASLLWLRIGGGGAGQASGGSSPFGVSAGGDACPPDVRADVGYMVRMNATAAKPAVALDAAARGIRQPLLAENKPSLASLGIDRAYVSNSNKANELPAGVEAVKPLYMQAADPDLHTCDFRLEDKPAAMALRNAATKYLIDTGMVPAAKFSDLSTQWYVSDDTLPNGLIAVYTLLQTPAAAGQSSSRDVIMTVFKGKNGPIVDAARVNLYAADTADQ